MDDKSPNLKWGFMDEGMVWYLAEFGETGNMQIRLIEEQSNQCKKTAGLQKKKYIAVEPKMNKDQLCDSIASQKKGKHHSQMYHISQTAQRKKWHITFYVYVITYGVSYLYQYHYKGLRLRSLPNIRPLWKLLINWRILAQEKHKRRGAWKNKERLTLLALLKIKKKETQYSSLDV